MPIGSQYNTPVMFDHLAWHTVFMWNGGQLWQKVSETMAVRWRSEGIKAYESNKRGYLGEAPEKKVFFPWDKEVFVIGRRPDYYKLED